MGIYDSNPVVLSATDLDIRLAGSVLLDKQELVLREGERVGLIGRNGSGKSTLLRVLAGQEHFFTGEISTRKGLRIAFLPQELDLPTGRTVRDCILAGADEILNLIHEYETTAPGQHLHDLEMAITARDGWNVESRLDMLLTALNAPSPERVIDTLSGGERRRVGLAQTLIDLPDLLLLDEPTNHLDAETIEWLEDFLMRSNRSCLFVTHDRYFLERLATRILELSYGRVYSYDGNYSEFLRRKTERLNEAEAQEEKRLAFIRREIDWIRRGPQARTTKSRSRIQRFEAAVNQDALQRERDIDLLLPSAPKMGNIIVSLQQVTLCLGERTLFANLDLEFTPGMRLGIVGRNGAGKTSLLRLILGELAPTAGVVRIGERVVFNYADQHRVSLHDDLTVYEEVGEGNDFVMFGERKINIWAYLKNYLFQDDTINTKVGQLSGGERNRLVLAMLLKTGGNFLLLDEPTNDLDLPTLRVLEEALCDFEGCVAVVSHDRYFLNRVCTHILVFEPDGTLFFQPGNYSYYAQKRAERQAAQKSDAKPAAAVDSGKTERASDGVRRLKWAEKRELEGMEQAIVEAEAEVSELEEIFSRPDFHATYGRQSDELLAKLNAAKAEVARLYDRWAELEEIANA